MKPIYRRTPVVLSDAGIEAWLDPATAPDQALELLRRAPETRWSDTGCVPAVGSNRNESPELIKPAPNSA